MTFGRDLQLAGQDVDHARHVETAQAAPGAQPGAALDGIVGGGRDGTVDLGQDLALGHLLAAADDAPVAGIVPDQGCLLFMGQVAEERAWRADGLQVLFFGQFLAGILEQLDHAQRDGRRGGQTRAIRSRPG